MKNDLILSAILVLFNSCVSNETKKLDLVLKEVIDENKVMLALKSTQEGENKFLQITVQSPVKNDFNYGKILLSIFEKLRSRFIVYEEYCIMEGKSKKLSCSVDIMNSISRKVKLFNSSIGLLKEKKFDNFIQTLSPELKESYGKSELKEKIEQTNFALMDNFEGCILFEEKNVYYAMFATSSTINSIRLVFDLSPYHSKVLGVQLN